MDRAHALIRPSDAGKRFHVAIPGRQTERHFEWYAAAYAYAQGLCDGHDYMEEQRKPRIVPPEEKTS